MKAQPIKYEDVLAMPGSDLYSHLIKGDMKKAKASYEETERRHNQLMARTKSGVNPSEKGQAK